MPRRFSLAELPVARGTIVAALSLWLVCAVWIGTRLHLLPVGHAANGSGQLEWMARTALILLSLVLIALFAGCAGQAGSDERHDT